MSLNDDNVINEHCLRTEQFLTVTRQDDEYRQLCEVLVY